MAQPDEEGGDEDRLFAETEPEPNTTRSAASGAIGASALSGRGLRPLTILVADARSFLIYRLSLQRDLTTSAARGQRQQRTPSGTGFLGMETVNTGLDKSAEVEVRLVHDASLPRVHMSADDVLSTPKMVALVPASRPLQLMILEPSKCLMVVEVLSGRGQVVAEGVESVSLLPLHRLYPSNPLHHRPRRDQPGQASAVLSWARPGLCQVFFCAHCGPLVWNTWGLNRLAVLYSPFANTPGSKCAGKPAATMVPPRGRSQAK